MNLSDKTTLGRLLVGARGEPTEAYKIGRAVGYVQRVIIRQEQERLLREGAWDGICDGYPGDRFAQVWNEYMFDICDFYEWVDEKLNRYVTENGLPLDKEPDVL